MKSTSAPPAACPRATICTTSSTVWCGLASRSSNASSTPCRPRIALAGVGKSRGPARDGATIFDENAALLVVRDNADGAALVQALRNHRWSEAFVERRASFGVDAQVWLFGHALMEKLVAPRKAITAHTRVVVAGTDFFDLDHDSRRAWLDARVAQDLAAHGLSTADFTPLPVLGIPGWWPDQDQAFYDDATVFRPKRQAAAP